MKSISTLLMFITFFCNAQTPVAGTLDTNFGDSGSVFPAPQKNIIPYAINVQPHTGEIMTTGQYKNVDGKNVGYIGRYDFYGNPKANFGTNGVLEFSHLSDESVTIYRGFFATSEPDSPIYIRGIYKTGTVSTPFITRILTDGTIDNSYGTNGSITGIRGEIHGDYIYSLTLNPVTSHQTFKRYLLADGTLDATFNNEDLPFLNTETSFLSSQYDNINVQDDGKIILCGSTTFNGIKVPFIGKYDNTGHLDTSFGDNGYYKADFEGEIFYTRTQSDGKIVYLNSTLENGTPTKLLSRVNSNGTLDTSYGTSGYFLYTFPFGGYVDNLQIRSDNKVVFVGSKVTQSNGGSSTLFSAMVSNTGTLDFWREDLESLYSENWALILIKDSYALSFGYTTQNFSTFSPVIQKIYLKSPGISLNGTSLSDETTNLDLVTTDGIDYSAENVVLSTGDIKFRLDHTDACYWGAAATNPFPSGVAILGNEPITVETAGTYKVTFNIKTGAYSFVKTLGLNTPEEEKTTFVFYPNPAQEKLIFNVNLQSIKVYTIEGKLVGSKLTNNEINISSLNKGVYFFQAITENGSIIGNKFIKE